MSVAVRLLGGFEVVVEGRTVAARSWRRRSAANLVKLLALQPGRRMLRDQVIDLLWPDLLVDEAAPRLHSAAHYARSALALRDGIVLDAGAVLLLPEVDCTVDVVDFERAARAAEAAGDPEAADTAASLYTGDVLPDDLYEPWTEEPRARLRLLYLDLLRAAGRHADLVAADPLDEDAHLALARDHLRQGRADAALRSLDRMAELFDRELGLEPGPAAAALREQAELRRAGVVEAAPHPAGSVPPTPVAGPRRLPAPRTRLIGRRADLDAVATLLRSHRVVTITGPGGAGKSTVALALARRLQPADGSTSGTEVVLSELASVQDTAGMTRAVAEAAGVQGEGAVHLQALAANLSTRTLLLVLDNCEHLLDSSAALVDALLDTGRRVRILVTSREPLRVDGEGVHRIGSLGADAAELFVERAAAAVGSGVVSADDPQVVDLCVRLDGLPLAIELAAAQLRHLSLGELVERLDDRLDLLVGSRPRAGARHSALAATIDSSYRLLSPDTRRVFDRLGVFPGDFDLGAAVAVARDAEPEPSDSAGREPAEVTNALGDLVAKSLVVHDPVRGRYRLLESIRLFAAQRLEESGSRPDAAERLRAHLVARATAQPRAHTWLSTSTAARSRDDLDNVRMAFVASLGVGDVTAAVDLALGISTLWRNAVSYAEGRRWVERLAAYELSERDRVWTLILTADLGLGSGDPRMMRTAYEEALPLVARLDDVGATVITHIYAAILRFSDPSDATGRLGQAIDLARAGQEPGLERLARGFRLLSLRLLGRTDGLDAEIRGLVEGEPAGGYDRYICLWAASLVALVDRDGPALEALLDAQLHDLAASGLRENWLTMYWQALRMMSSGEDHLGQLRRSLRRAEAEGRRADADGVLALAYAEACQDQWVSAAELLGAAEGALLRDTAGFIHHALLHECLVRPRLDPVTFEAATLRGRGRSLPDLLDEYGV